MVNSNRRLLLPAVVVFAAAVFVVDLLTPRAFEVWVLYLPAIFAPVLFNSDRDVIWASITCSAFLILGVFISPLETGLQWWEVVNRGLGLATIWLTTFAGITIVKRSLQVAETMRNLHDAIARQEQAKQALAQSEERLRLAVAGAGMGTWDVDLRTGDANWSETPFRMLGHDPAQSGEANWEMWLSRNHADDLGRVLDGQERARPSESIVSSEVRIRRASSGDVVWLAVFGRFAYDESGDAVRFTGVSFDITQRKELECEALEIVAREQRRIGRELHDSVGQELTGLGLIAHSLAQGLTPGDPARRIASRVLGGIERVHEQVRAISHGLVPFQIEAGGLRAALDDLVARSSVQSGIQVGFECSESVEVPDDTTARQLYRIAQEAVSNAIRHGKPRHIDLTLDSDANGLQLRVQDDGVGIAQRSNRPDGMGTRIMRYRAGLVGGILRIDSRDGSGTLVTCTVPRRHDDGEERRGLDDTGSTEGSGQSANRR